MAGDPRDVYLFTATSSVSFTFASPEDVRTAALEKLASARYDFMTDDERRIERDRVEAALSRALLILADPDAMIADIPGMQKQSGRVTVEPCAPLA